jgi:NitT/TauT family transport system ATP-binding protein
MALPCPFSPFGRCKIVSDQPFLRCAHVGKSFTVGKENKTLMALQDVSFDQSRGDVVALLGPSGCGKSTLLRIMAGLAIATSGEITINGARIIGPGRDRGLVFQAYTAFDWMTVQQNVEFGMALNGTDLQERRERANHFIDLVQLSRFRNAYPASLSGGMKQRLAIARTFANQPDVILMDEPFGALDSETRWVMQELLLSIVRETRATVVIVTHDLEEAIFLSDHIVFMAAHPGRIHEKIPITFKSGMSNIKKEDLVEMVEYRALQKHLMIEMRNASSEHFVERSE